MSGREPQVAFLRRYRISITAPYWATQRGGFTGYWSQHGTYTAGALEEGMRAGTLYRGRTLTIDNQPPDSRIPEGIPGEGERVPEGHQFRIEFNISTGIDLSYAIADIRIYGIDKSSWEKINHSFTSITVWAGYQDVTGIIFEGNFLNAFYGWQPDGTRYAKILARSAHTPIPAELVPADPTKVSRPYLAGWPVSSIIFDVAQSFRTLNFHTGGLLRPVTVRCGLTSGADQLRFLVWLTSLGVKLKGYTPNPSSQREMDILAMDYGFQWGITGTILAITPREMLAKRGEDFTGIIDKASEGVLSLFSGLKASLSNYMQDFSFPKTIRAAAEQPIEISRKTGMIGSPVIRDFTGISGSGEHLNMVTVTSIINPNITIGRYFNLVTDIPTVEYTAQAVRRVGAYPQTTEMYVVREINYKGDSHGNRWLMEIGAYPVMAVSRSPMDDWGAPEFLP